MCLDLGSDSGVAKINDQWCGKKIMPVSKLHTVRLAQLDQKGALLSATLSELNCNNSTSASQWLNETIQINCTLISEQRQLKLGILQVIKRARKLKVDGKSGDL